MISVKKAVAIGAVSAAALIGTSATSALPASASTSAATPAADPIVCGGNGFVCVQNLSGSARPSTIKAWADTKSFDGQFELKFSNGTIKKSSQQEWMAGGAGFDFTGIPAGSYQMIALQPPTTVIGTLNFSV